VAVDVIFEQRKAVVRDFLLGDTTSRCVLLALKCDRVVFLASVIELSARFADGRLA